MVVGSLAHTGGQYSYYSLMLSGSPVIIQDTRLEINDAPLTFIFPMGQLACRLPCYIDSRPIPSL